MAEKEKKYRICWESNTGYRGEGEEILDLETARVWRDQANNTYPELGVRHWIESEKEIVE